MQDPRRSDKKEPSEVETPDFQIRCVVSRCSRYSYTTCTSLYNKEFYKVVSFRTNFIYSIHPLICLNLQAALEKGHQEECSAAARQATTLVFSAFNAFCQHLLIRLNMSVLISDSGWVGETSQWCTCWAGHIQSSEWRRQCENTRS